eukprot:jgi/Ulvmu1/12769/UM096_0011.1
MQKILAQCVVAAACAAGVSAQIVVKPQSVLDGVADILTAEVGIVGAQVPLCNGTNDLLPVTFTFPLAGMPTPEDFEITIGTLGRNVSSVVQPTCATLAPAAEPNERRTVLLLGEFTPGEGLGPITVTVVGNLSLLVNGTEESVMGSSIDSGLDDFFFLSSGPRVVDFEILDPAVPANIATADPNGCAATFPATTYILRLIFGAGVRQITNGTLENLGTNITAARANEFFTLRAFGIFTDGDGGISRDVLLGLADVDPDNYLDLCIQSTSPFGSGLQSLLRVNCGGLLGEDEASTIFDPAGDPCRRQTVLLPSLGGNASSVQFSFDSSSASASSDEGPESSMMSSNSSSPDGSAMTSTAASAMAV